MIGAVVLKDENFIIMQSEKDLFPISKPYDWGELSFYKSKTGEGDLDINHAIFRQLKRVTGKNFFKVIHIEDTSVFKNFKDFCVNENVCNIDELSKVVFLEFKCFV